MTLSLLALWFLILEKDRLGGRVPALTVPQMREVFARLLRPDPAGAPASPRRSAACGVATRRPASTTGMLPRASSHPVVVNRTGKTVTVELDTCSRRAARR